MLFFRIFDIFCMIVYLKILFTRCLKTRKSILHRARRESEIPNSGKISKFVLLMSFFSSHMNFSSEGGNIPWQCITNLFRLELGNVEVKLELLRSILSDDKRRKLKQIKGRDDRSEGIHPEWMTWIEYSIDGRDRNAGYRRECMRNGETTTRMPNSN